MATGLKPTNALNFTADIYSKSCIGFRLEETMKRTFAISLAASAIYFLSLYLLTGVTHPVTIAKAVVTGMTMILFGAIAVIGFNRGWSSPILVFISYFAAHVTTDWIVGFEGNFHGAAMQSLFLFVVAAIGCVTNPANWEKLGKNTGVHPAFQAFVFNAFSLIPFIPFFVNK